MREPGHDPGFLLFPGYAAACILHRPARRGYAPVPYWIWNILIGVENDERLDQAAERS
jgi:hypothetical protein